MSKSLDRVLQPGGSYKWEQVELKHSTAPVETCPAPAPKETKKKVSKKKTTSPLSD